ncbi:hypothetical protein GDO86_019841 [Hymenochirus boettgeri]|uniref:Uncharacterized protein n=1 Tax=Hymenochirus boettgeri TaxID=247094 RepID=A0A8T2IFS5_9PIPI|nr:hypothetical protein GDO86_019841 [Hymenochirus boettgeri]
MAHPAGGSNGDRGRSGTGDTWDRTVEVIRALWVILHLLHVNLNKIARKIGQLAPPRNQTKPYSAQDKNKNCTDRFWPEGAQCLEEQRENLLNTELSKVNTE